MIINSEVYMRLTKKNKTKHEGQVARLCISMMTYELLH